MRCELCGGEYPEEEMVEIEKDGKVLTVCKGCATGMKGLA